MTETHKWEGFYGPRSDVLAAMALLYALPSVGARVPPPADGVPLPEPEQVDEDGTEFMFAVQTPAAAAPLPVPPNLKRARAELVGRLLRA